MSSFFEKKAPKIKRSITVDPDVEEFLQYLTTKGVKISPLVVEYFRSTEDFKTYVEEKKNEKRTNTF